MNDHEINKRLAEIAGVAVCGNEDEGLALFCSGCNGEGLYDEDGPMTCGVCRGDGVDPEPRMWSPLTNWAQLGPLMEREGVECVPYENDDGGWGWWVDGAGSFGDKRVGGNDLKRAICLAIIEAHS